MALALHGVQQQSELWPHVNKATRMSAVYGRSDMSDRIEQVPDGDHVRELSQVLTHIFEMARRLPPGAERIAALPNE